MEYRMLGRTELKVSQLCMGTMQFGWTADEAVSFQILSRSYEAGINFIDTADIYSRWAPGNPGGISETIIGKWMKNNHIPRDKVILATKVRGQMGDGPNDEGLSRAHIIQAIEASLKRLNTDYIDLYQTHWYDENVPIEETLSTLDALVQQGKVRYLGCSNHPAWRLTEALWTSRYHNLARYDCLQPHFNLVHRAEFERELAEVCSAYGLAVIPYSPLAGGFLTGKYRSDAQTESARSSSVRRYFSEQNFKLLDEMEAMGRTRGNVSISQIALAWLLSNELISSPIIGPRTLSQLEDNLGAAGLCLSPQEKERLDLLTSWK